MWIAIGLIGALWFIGGVVAPDKNAPPPSHSAAPATAMASAAPVTPALPR